MVEIQKINNFTNVQTVGYVRTGYATRNISDVLADVAVYSGWNTNANATTGTKLSVHGIFFDEAPSEYSSANAEYMLTINQAVKEASGFLGQKTVRAFQITKMVQYLQYKLIDNSKPGNYTRHSPSGSDY
jgi:hypothetical protein